MLHITKAFLPHKEKVNEDQYEVGKDHWELEELDGLTGGVLEGTNVISMGSNMSGRKKRSADGAADSRYNIPVDESIEKMIVTVSTTKLDTKGGYFLQGQHPAIWAI